MASVACGFTNSETVANIFRSMNLEKEVIDVSIGKKLIDDDFSEVIISSADLKDTLNFGINKQIPKYEISKPRIEKFVKWLIENKNDLIAALVTLKYTWNNALLIINRFIDSVKFYKIECQINPCAFKDVATYINCAKDTLMVIQNIAQSFFTGGKTFLLCLKIDQLLPFYCMIAKISKSVGFMDKFSVCVLDPHEYGTPFDGGTMIDYRTMESLLLICNDIVSSCCVIITEDGDISAAADCIAKSICQSQIQESYSVSHIFIQESVYQLTVSILKERLSHIKYGSRFDKKTELELLLNEMNETSLCNLEVFSPCERSPVKLCIGWNPKDIDEASAFSKVNGYIIVIPYRNIAEMKSLIKDNIKPMSPTAVWSERINVIRMDLEDQFSSIWINCHGLVHPLALSKAPCFALSGVHFIFGDDAKKNQAALKSNVQLQNSLINKSYLNWQKRKVTLQIKLLNMAKETKNCKDCLSNLKMDLNKLMSLVEDDEKVSFKAKCSFSIKPVGMILIFCSFSEVNSALSDILRKIVITALINGNSVSVGANSDLIMSCKKCLEDLLQMLPDGVLTFKEELSVKCFFSSFNLVVPYIGTYLCMTANFIDVFDNTFFGKHLKINSSDCLCNSILSNLTSVTQGSWIA